MHQTLITDLDIKDNIRSLRIEKGFTQDQVAAKLQAMDIKMSRSWFSAIELGKRNVSVKVLVGLKIIFKCSFDAFFEGLEKALLDGIK